MEIYDENSTYDISKIYNLKLFNGEILNNCVYLNNNSFFCIDEIGRVKTKYSGNSVISGIETQIN